MSAPVGESGGPVAITGAGVLTPLGDNLESLREALRGGKSAVGPVEALGGAGGASIRDFDASRYAAIRGLRLYNIATKLGVCAVKLASCS